MSLPALMHNASRPSTIATLAPETGQSFADRVHSHAAILMLTFAALMAVNPTIADAQRTGAGGATLTGRVTEAETGQPIAVAEVRVEGTRLAALSDSTGHYRLEGVPPGPQVLIVTRLGYADARVPITVPATGTLTRDIEMATSALEVEGLIVTATPSGRAEGELGTASVIDREAIANQSAASLAGVLELVPGVPLQPPGLDGVQQIPLRTVPTPSAVSLTLGGPTAADLASFGTSIILDGVPLSNNSNLQTTGPRGELRAPSSAGGGIDLRRIPATTIQKVEVIRGVPSARYGDLTQGAVIVETRAGEFDPALQGRWDARLVEASGLAGERFGSPHALSGTFDFARNEIRPGIDDDDSDRVSAQLAHRATLGRERIALGARPKLTLDTRLDFWQVNANNPEDPEVDPGDESFNRDRGLRLLERARIGLADDLDLHLIGSVDYTRRRSFVQSLRFRGAMPFTDRLTEGRAEGRFIGGNFLSRVDIDGDEFQIFSRLELDKRASWLGFHHRLRGGAVLRREWNAGAGFQFDIERPPQVAFNGVQGFDRPRHFDAIPAVATTALYLDDRLTRTLGSVALDLQAGLRLDLLHDGGDPLTGVRDAELQPRLNVQIAPLSWLRLRGGWGRTAKRPSLGQLFPAPQYFDVVNVNFFADEPEERLAVLTTFIRDPTNPDLGFSTARKAELGLELAPGRGDVSFSLVGFSDRIEGGVGISSVPGFVPRGRFQLTDSVQGNGVPPAIIEPPFATDTMPVLIDRPSNNLVLETRGLELTASLPELRPLRTRLDIQGAWIRTEFFKEGLDFGAGFGAFQLDARDPRNPFWEDPVRVGERALFTYRAVHHQPALGLVVTATVEHFAFEKDREIAATDSLAFEGFITRDGRLVRVPPERRADPEFADLREPRAGIFVVSDRTPADWLLSLQITKTLPGDGRLSFFAFNTLDRLGAVAEEGFTRRLFPFVRFGVEATLPLGRWIGR